ncbi:MAG: hypothetical protein A2504_13825 [Bdellovibrionales bacterium RIFOXYD12_FULL_39_22]|nr:MAG: hypothetical protein A2385_00550 [Bdellovibrionales bacterium RIFOXYB1_FULL_39_21]OFZ43833.1 MAG: hypothetical protein A2485_04980 [Bdellovibrionales bacterium RIFOXYC12_FULL_39_17]OFZ48833.1 MAG: hypothetical protein A2404_17865 [Bdellovibrionales bacterium RIFOXYC1_FULL_39_130]OFZ76566.1 MAG: hypothetical protein A2560_06530 [Bdellovibrionales bacterium RIFOXYD1_FULL_39_84]OFZ94800.1 MAG: hypothetical protein A2504_13825 [Bdellovibrionales bacterium RIFOXYD12_FULL_39_22]
MLEDNPIILSGNYNLDHDYNLNLLLSSRGKFITNSSTLTADCSMGDEVVDSCFQVRKDSNAVSSIYYKNQKWAFPVGSDEFHQVLAYYHTYKIVNKFNSALYSAMQTAYGPDLISPQYTLSALPQDLISMHAFWPSERSLRIYAVSGELDNSVYQPADFSISYGEDRYYNTLKWVQDPTIIYHETAHALIHLMLNLRNNASAGISTRADLGHLYYDEAGSIGEGISDYFSYFINGRNHLGEWAVGRYLNLSRPIDEDDPIHALGIAKTPEGRLSYPNYLNYDPNNSSIKIEDVHNSGMIVSHYLIALTESLAEQCSLTTTTAQYAVVHIMAEALAELGDFTSQGNDSNIAENYYINHSPAHAPEWQRVANPINFRSFFQRMAKATYMIFNDYGQSVACNGSTYPKDKIETLLDQYGLLLFKTYNENGNDKDDGHDGTSTAVNVANRLHTTLVAKDFVKLDPTQNATPAFIFDKRSDMLGAVSDLRASGQITEVSPLIPDDLAYNNGNGKISPGEIVGVMLNLYNDSNSPIAGVQVIANKWDHVKSTAPCNNLGDNWPTIAEGGAAAGNSGTPGDCEYISRENGDEDEEDLGEACFVQLNEDNATKWVTQSEFVANSASISPEQCLGGANNTQSCLVRVIPNMDQAFYSKMDAKSTWTKTVFPNGQEQDIRTSHIIMMETSPWIAPGTTFNCRFRLRFSNCEDCYSDASYSGDDYLDYEYSGGKPFKIVHFQFIVIN